MLQLIHKPVWLLILSLFLTPLTGTVMVAIDYKRLLRKDWLFVACAPFFLTLVISLIDVAFITSVDLPALLYPTALSFTYYAYQTRLQEEHAITQFEPVIKSFGIGLIALVGSLLLLTPLYFL